MTRRQSLQLMAAGAATAAAASAANAAPAAGDADREARMKWWHEARFGMFIHWGLYSTLGRHEWAMEEEGIPVAEYEQQAKLFKPKPNAARDWARLAKLAGQKYMVMTTKHHEGFCQFDTKLTDYCAPKQGPGRDLVKEFVEAARGEGLRVGFYYSLMDWHHPDGARCATDEPARRRFVDYIHGHIRELMTNYGKVDVLWYDVNWPLSTRGMGSREDERDGLPAPARDHRQQPQRAAGRFLHARTDHSRRHPRLGILHDHERQLGLPEGRRRLEEPEDDCAQPGDLRARYRQLSAEYRPQGGWLHPRGIGAHPDRRGQMDGAQRQHHLPVGKVPAAPFRIRHASRARATRLYMHVHFWPGSTVALGGLTNQVKSARLLVGGKEVKFDQDKFRVRFTGLPEKAPDDPVTTIAIECDGEPHQDTGMVRRERPRRDVGISA